MNQDKKAPEKRAYPPVYEKLMPFALGIVAVFIVILIIVSLIVVVGVFPGS